MELEDFYKDGIQEGIEDVDTCIHQISICIKILIM